MFASIVFILWLYSIESPGYIKGMQIERHHQFENISLFKLLFKEECREFKSDEICQQSVEAKT
jgi:hypothetical protein